MVVEAVAIGGGGGGDQRLRRRQSEEAAIGGGKDRGEGSGGSGWSAVRGGHHCALPRPLPRRGCPGEDAIALLPALCRGGVVPGCGADDASNFDRYCTAGYSAWGVSAGGSGHVSAMTRRKSVQRYFDSIWGDDNRSRIGTTDRTWRGMVLTARTNTSRAIGDWVASTCLTPASMEGRMGGWAGIDTRLRGCDGCLCFAVGP